MWLSRHLRHALYLSRNLPFGICELGGGIANWETGSGSRALPLHPDHCVNEVIQGAPHALESVSSDQSVFGRDRSQFVEIVRYLPGLRVILGPDFAWIGFPSIVPTSFEISDMLLGPFQLSDDVIINGLICHP